MALDIGFRDHWGRVLATLVGILGDIERAEDAAQEALAIAADRWPRDGEPDDPIGWLITTRAKPRDRPHSPACPGRQHQAART
jgi:RNA polymerase sigma-70 factor (ECF subfamily)